MDIKNALAVFFLFFLGGCTNPDSDMIRLKTIGSLRTLEASVVNYSKKEEIKFQSLNEFLKEAIKMKIVAELHDGYLEKDGWGMPFRLVWINNKVFQIQSAGSNGIFENGFGDDLYLQVDISDKNQIKTFIKS